MEVLQTCHGKTNSNHIDFFNIRLNEKCCVANEECHLRAGSKEEYTMPRIRGVVVNYSQVQQYKLRQHLAEYWLSLHRCTLKKTEGRNVCTTSVKHGPVSGLLMTLFFIQPIILTLCRKQDSDGVNNDLHHSSN